MILSQAIDSLRVLLALHDSTINGASAIDTNDARIANDLIPAMGALLGSNASTSPVQAAYVPEYIYISRCYTAHFLM